MMFTIRPYTEKDAAACGECLYEGFFTAPVEDCDKIAGNIANHSTGPWQTDMRAKSTMACGAGCSSNTI